MWMVMVQSIWAHCMAVRPRTNSAHKHTHAHTVYVVYSHKAYTYDFWFETNLSEM